MHVQNWSSKWADSMKSSLLRKTGSCGIRMAAAGKAAAVQEPLVAYLQSPWVVESEYDYVEALNRLVSKHPDVSLDRFALSYWIADSHRLHGRRLSAARRFMAAGLRHKRARGLLMAGTALVDPGLADRIRRARAGPSPDWLALYPTPDMSS